jgi:hypothetical protein
MRPTLISATFLLALAGSALAQDETAPDFSGTWIFSSSSNGEQDPHPYRLQINQDDATVAVNGRSYLLGGTTLTEQGSSPKTSAFRSGR